MTESAQETEKPATKERVKGKSGATFFTYAGWGIIGVIAGYLLSTFNPSHQRPGAYLIFAIFFVALVPAIIGLIVRLVSDKEVTWYRKTAAIAGFLVGAIVGFA